VYTTTFYSFKGGVGRTMALVNTAVDLANRGRRVVAVDFDLEAPGLDSFTLLRPLKPRPGLIDFVHQFRETGQSPDVADFIYRASGIGKDGGELWVMPAGAGRDDYGVRFRDLDWADLYDRYDGYLLFEDLKAQLEKSLKADWVLVDSRTGHTDTGGICTRQLPDAVVVVFFPNEQNLRGLTGVVRDIRAEAETGRKKQIELHFVMSNVPDLDDEDQILQQQIKSFQKELNMERPPVFVHRYDSLALLNQSVFIQDRPRSRLAREYEAVVDRIVSMNLEDPDGARLYLEGHQRRWRFDRTPRESMKERAKNLDHIEKKHGGNPGLLFELGRLYASERSHDDAARLFQSAIEAGCAEPQALLFRSRMRSESGDEQGATADAMTVLAGERIPPRGVAEALALASSPAGSLIASAAVRSLEVEDRIWVALELHERNEHSKGIALLESLGVAGIEGQLGLLYLGSRRYQDAAKLLANRGRGENRSVEDSFNYAMAAWGASGKPDRDLFQRVLLRLSESDHKKDANFHQCLALANWACGDQVAANQHLDDSLRALDNSPARSLMSCWSYEHVSRAEFREHVDEIRKLIGGDETVQPRFLPSGTSRTGTRAASLAAYSKSALNAASTGSE